jgi:hypothetical protein
MTAAPAPTPGGRTLLAWWRDLAPLHPVRLWFAHLLLHRVEALTRVARAHPLDPLQLALLRSLSVPASANGTAPPGAGALPLDRQVLDQLLRQLAARGLARSSQDTWEVTDEGRRALAEGRVVSHALERRVFYFADGDAPHYLPLCAPATSPLEPAPEGWRFDPAALEECVRRPPEWKARHGFPAEVEGVYRLAPGAGDWRHVILDRAEQALLVLVEVRGEPALLGFAVRPDGWVLLRDRPVLALGAGWPEVLPGPSAPAPAEDWQHAWQAWCRPRGIPPAEVASCRLEPAGHRLVVHAPRRLVDRLRSARSDAVKGEAWLLAGAGPFRPAALIELVEVP